MASGIAPGIAAGITGKAGAMAAGFGLSKLMSGIKKNRGAIAGGVQAAAGGLMLNKSSGSMPPEVDYSQQVFLDEINRRRKNLNYGAASQFQQNSVRKASAGMIDPMVRSGDPILIGIGGALAADVENIGMNQFLSTQSQNESMYLPIADKIATGISQRSFDTRMYRHLIMRAMAGRMIQGGLDNSQVA